MYVDQFVIRFEDKVINSQELVLKLATLNKVYICKAVNTNSMYILYRVAYN